MSGDIVTGVPGGFDGVRGISAGAPGGGGGAGWAAKKRAHQRPRPRRAGAVGALLAPGRLRAGEGE
eukprot:339207-Pyramimonas_sp.AAC.1